MLNGGKFYKVDLDRIIQKILTNRLRFLGYTGRIKKERGASERHPFLY